MPDALMPDAVSVVFRNPSNNCERCGKQYRTDSDSRKIQPDGQLLYQSCIDPDICNRCGEAVIEACDRYSEALAGNKPE